MERDQNRELCDLCNALLTRERWFLSDGRVICSDCKDSAIFTAEKATKLYEEIKDLIAALVGIRLNVPTGLALVDLNQLKEVIRRQSPGNGDQNELALEKTLGIYARRGMKRAIYIQIGLPQTLFLQVAAHEYTHAWQGENCPLIKDPILHEGLAEWVAYKVLGAYGYKERLKKMLDRQDIYGQGLKWAIEMEAHHGKQAVISACRGVS
jgi:hypothetical protein